MRTSLRAVLPALLLGTAVLTAACGGDDSDDLDTGDITSTIQDTATTLQSTASSAVEDLTPTTSSSGTTDPMDDDSTTTSTTRAATTSTAG